MKYLSLEDLHFFLGWVCYRVDVFLPRKSDGDTHHPPTFPYCLSPVSIRLLPITRTLFYILHSN